MAINLLSPKIYNRIAAGEVVERPASVVKELVENSLDAGASKIRIEIEGGGIDKILVADDGCGISKDDLPLAFMPHATSKISGIDDLDAIATLGFRGEALASIAAVSRVSLTTKQKGSESGFKISADGGEISRVEEIARLDGTTLCVQNLFFNTPVRAKFLKKPKSEESEITHLVEKFMLARPEVGFTYVVDGKEVYSHTSGQLSEVIYLLYGREVFDNLLALDFEDYGIKVSGFVVSPRLSKPNRTYQSLFVNGRYVENYMVSACVQGAYESVLMKGRFPIYAIKLEIPFERVDVNVHPNKREVKFDDNSQVFGVIRRAVEKALLDANLIAQFEYRTDEDYEKNHIKNDEHPGMTSFNSFQKGADKLAENEGASFKVQVESGDAEKPLETPRYFAQHGVQLINIPNFADVKSDKLDNRPGGRIVFDHPGNSVLREVEIAVQKDMQKEKNEQKSGIFADFYEKNKSNVDENSSKQLAKHAGIQSGNISEDFAQILPQKTQFEEEKFLKADANEIKIVGVVFKTYIITEFGESIFVIDQHAMHERQNYDRLKEQIDKQNVAKQDLLLPYEFTLLAKDCDIFAAKITSLREIGFEISQQGSKFSITAVPFVLAQIDLKKYVEEILSDDVLRQQTASGILNEKLCQTACKHSIRAGDSVSKDEILYLINKIKDGVPLCPHGRPIIVQITKKELEKMFKRTL